jgi:hypothetical protein
MKLTSTLFFLCFTLINISCSAQDKKEEDNTLIIETKKNGVSKTVTFDFTDLEKGLENLGKALEKMGENIEANIESTDYEIIVIEESNNETKITVKTTDDDGNETETEYFGDEAESYISKRILDFNGSLKMDVKKENDDDNVHIELDIEDFLEDIGITVETNSKENKTKKKIIIISKSDSKAEY